MVNNHLWPVIYSKSPDWVWKDFLASKFVFDSTTLIAFDKPLLKARPNIYSSILSIIPSMVLLAKNKETDKQFLLWYAQLSNAILLPGFYVFFPNHLFVFKTDSKLKLEIIFMGWVFKIIRLIPYYWNKSIKDIFACFPHKILSKTILNKTKICN